MMFSKNFRRHAQRIGIGLICLAGFTLQGCGGSGGEDTRHLFGGLGGSSIVGPGTGQPGPGNGDPVPFGPPGPPGPSVYGELLSTPDGVTPGNGRSEYVTISDSGRYVAFDSLASNLVAGDTNGVKDVFLRDRQTNTIRLISRFPNGNLASAESRSPQISADGSVVIFTAGADLVPEDTNGQSDVYLYRVADNSIELVSWNDDGDAAGDRGSEVSGSTVSDSGRFVLFQSDATNLVDNDLNDRKDVFLRDRQSGTTERVSIGSLGQEADDSSFSFQDGLSADGRYMTFWSTAPSLLPTGVTDTNSNYEMYLRDRQTGETRLLTRAAGGTTTSDGTSGYVTWMSPDGETLLFSGNSTNLTTPSVAIGSIDQIFRYTVATDTFQVLTTFPGGQFATQRSYGGSLTSDGRYLMYVRQRPTSTPLSGLEDEYDTISHIVLRDLTTGEERLVTGTLSGAESNGFAYTWQASMRADGSEMVFASDATNLAAKQVSTTFSQAYLRKNPFSD